MLKQKLAQTEANSVFVNIEERKDTNAHLFLSINLDEGIDVTGVQPQVLDEDTNTAIDFPLNLYLSSVFYDCPETQKLLLEQGEDTKVTSQSVAADQIDDWSNAVVSRNLGSRLNISGANDVAWAVLSDSPDALLNLCKNYDALGKSPQVNTKIDSLNIDQKPQWTTLELAIIKHVSQSKHHAFKKSDLDRQSQEMHAFMDDIFKEFMGVDPQEFQGGLSKLFDNAYTEEASTPNPTERNIVILLQLGAQSTGAKDFPKEKGTVINPFSSEDGFEKMHLSDFCQAHKECFSPQLLAYLTRTDTKPSHEPAL